MSFFPKRASKVTKDFTECEDCPNPDAENCYCPWGKNLECYEGWYDEYWHKTHDEKGDPL